MGTNKLPVENQVYTVKGHMTRSGFRFSIKGCCIIDDIWYRPVVADYSGDNKTYRQPEEGEIGWDYIPFADDAVIDSWEKEEK